MKITHKLPLILAICVLLSIGGGLYGIFRLADLSNQYDQMIRVDYGNEILVDRMLLDFKIQVQNWKDTLLRGKDPASLDKYWGGFMQKEADVRQDASELQANLPPDSEAARLVSRFVQDHTTMGDNYRHGLSLFNAANHDPTVGDHSVAGMDRAPTHTLQAAGKAILENTRSHLQQIRQHRRVVMAWSLSLMVLVALLTIALAWWLIRDITLPLHRAVAIARQVANGDLSARFNVTRQDEFGELLTALKTMTEQLATVVSRVRQGTHTVTTATGEISAGNLDLSNRTEKQAGSLEEAASALEAITSTIRQSSDHTREASARAQQASEVAERGGAMVADVVQTMSAINNASRKIADIISVIDSIAFQTNILALNAAVEAARAGEQGRGFAVVASEVRNLAQRSATAAREIKSLIDDSVAQVELGNHQADRAGETMQEIVGSIRQVSTIIHDISNTSREQSRGMEEINQAISALDENTQQNAALVEQAAAAARSLQEQAMGLEHLVDAFVLADHVTSPQIREESLPLANKPLQRLPRHR